MTTGPDGFRLPTINQNEVTNKIESLRGEPDDCCKTFVIHDEDHTLGNALNHIIIQNPNVVFCGYTVPHPMERNIHIRVQTNDIPAVDILRESIKELKKQNEDILNMIKKEVKKNLPPMES